MTTATEAKAARTEPPDADRVALTKELAEAEARLTTAIAARDTRASALATAKTDATEAQASFEDGAGSPATAAQARSLVDVLASALVKNEAAVALATTARNEVAVRLQRAEDMVDVVRLATETAAGLEKMRARRREAVTAFSNGVGEFRTLQQEAMAIQKEFLEVLKRLTAGGPRGDEGWHFVQSLEKRGVDVSAVHLSLGGGDSSVLGRYKDPKLRFEKIGGWEIFFDQQTGFGF